MEDYVRRRHIEEGFDYVGTPHISKDGLFYTSGHLPYFAEGMFPPIHLEGAEYRLKAMNCPMHNLIYRSRGRSYRDLPLRLFEFGSVYRFEKSGVVHGLSRVRGMTQDDSHSYVTVEGAEAEVKHLLNFVLSLLRDFGLDDYYLELSTKDDSKDKFIGTDEQWEVATDVLEQAARETGLELVPDPGGAAFYGPKISVQARDAIGRTWQMSTVQYDFNQPEGFQLEYQAADGSRQRPVMIHSAKFGSIERFMAVLVEHYAGAFPVWLSPVQVTGIPVAEEFAPYLQDVLNRLRDKGVRVELDESDDRFPKKIRNASKSKVPYVLIAGEDDRAAGAVSFRYRDGSQRNGIPVDQAVAEITAAIASREQVTTAPSGVTRCACYPPAVRHPTASTARGRSATETPEVLEVASAGLADVAVPRLLERCPGPTRCRRRARRTAATPCRGAGGAPAPRSGTRRGHATRASRRRLALPLVLGAHRGRRYRLSLLTQPVAHGRRPPGPGDEAEGVTGRVGPDRAVRRRQPPSAQRGHLALGRRHVVDHDVVVHLLRPVRVAPHRGPMVGCPLERHPGVPVVRRDDDPVRRRIRDRHPQHGRPEPREPHRVGSVVDDVVQSADRGHDRILPPRRRVRDLTAVAVPLAG